MILEGSNSSTALVWVREDLDKLVQRVQLQLEHMASNPNAGNEALDTIEENVEHLGLTFEALSMNGAAMVTREMLALADHIRRYRVARRADALAALMDASVILPAYLDRLQAGHQDLPLLLLPVINGMRTTYDGAVLQENSLFAPDLEVDLPELELGDQQAGRQDPFPEFAVRMRQQFENALLNWLQEQDHLEHLSPLQGVCETLLHRVERRDLKRLWWVASEVIGGLNDGHTRNDPELRRLFARLHLNLKNLAEKGEDSTEPRSVNAMTRAFLFQAAQAKPGNSGIDMLCERFGLAAQMPDQEELLRARGAVSGRDKDMFDSLGQALQDELSLVKDALDLELRTGNIDRARRESSLESLGRVQDTLNMLGLKTSAASLNEIIPAFMESESAESQQRDEVLLSLASQILLIESALKEQIETLGEPVQEELEKSLIELPIYEQRRIRGHLLDEMVLSIHQFQDAVKARFSGNAEADLDEPLQMVAGALRLINETDVADSTLQLARVTGHLINKVYSESAVPARFLQSFTDAVAALELYLAASRDQQSSRERFKHILNDRLDSLPDSPEKAEKLQSRASQGGASVAATAANTSNLIEVVSDPLENDETEDHLPPEMDAELREVFIEEYEAVFDLFNKQIPEWLERLDRIELMVDIRRGFHTLKGSGRMVGAHELGDFCWQIEDLMNALLEGKISTYADVAVMVRLAHSALPGLKQRLLQQPAGLTGKAIRAVGQHAEKLTRGESADWQGLHARLPKFLTGMLPESPTYAEVRGSEKQKLRPPSIIDADEIRQNLVPIQTLLEQVSVNRETRVTRDHLRAIHSIAGALSMAPEGKDAEIAKTLEGLLEVQSHSGEPFGLEIVWTMGAAISHLQARLDRMDGEADAVGSENEQDLIDQIRHLTTLVASSGFVSQEPEQASDESTGASDEPGAEEAASESVEPSGEDTEFEQADPEIIRIFIEEAHEVLGRSDSILNNWRNNLNDLSLVRNLQREIHTFKGGARMAGFSALGDLSHEMEDLLERIAGKAMPPSEAAITALETGCDRLQAWISQLVKGEAPVAGDAVSVFEQQAQGLESQQPAAAHPPVADSPTRISVPASASSESKEAKALPEISAPLLEKTDEGTGQAQIRVDAELLDSLVNAAGEVSIFRSRMEQQIGNLRSGLGEFDETIARLKEQFRKLEIETETQIRSRYKDEEDARTEGFDPLELDRFSSMQQLSKGMSESVSDLLNLQEMLDEAARQSESLLHQQSRFTSELQEGLMQTRMVQFGSVAPRLRRLIRSAAHETGKSARLQLEMVGSSDQLDRNVLERVTAPLEHMLRNAIVHGIEKPEVRKKLNKPVEGKITITIESEATEFLIRITDDGAGIDLDAIRRKAIDLGMIGKNDNPPAQKLLEFILDSGFSTSSTVTGLAGRGVGMDVVNSEIKQIGGSLEISSEAGVGSRFTIRIPFTLAVMQAIGVTAGESRYLIPLASVAGVARIQPDTYLELLESDDPEYEFAGEQFPILELAPLLGEASAPLGADNISLLMIRAGDQRAAFRVPALLGHREIVIKPVGPQISSVPGILGGTVSAEGKVVVILDTGPLIRHALSEGMRPELQASIDDKPRQVLAMVVDDSITMRKVTSRVLESHNFEVITAKDGVDATEQMQERVPELLLLDIEMPRMDGYEVAEHVRADARLRHIPIIMITSRSGQKHRDRATQAGANAYLTKPYKESELILQVNQLLGKE